MTVVESLALTHRTKRCPNCQTIKLWKDFHPRTTWPDGTMRAPQGYCKDCRKVKLQEWRAANPTRKKELDRAAYRSVRTDPERDAIRRDQHREWYRKHRSKTPSRRAPRAPRTIGRQALDPRPFGAWLRTIGDTPLQISVVTGLEESQVRKYLTAARPVMEGVVDRVLCRVNTDTTLRDLYPELYQLGEADGHCAVGHPQGDSSSLAPRRSPTARSIQRSEQEAA